MTWGEDIVARLERAQLKGGMRDELLRMAVCEIQGAREHFDWVGIYLIEGSELVLHNYLGRPTDHDRIPIGTGVCGSAVSENRDINVADVRQLSNYLACSMETRAELVILIRDPNDGTVFGQLDLDSDRVGAFGEDDEAQLRSVASWLTGLFRPVPR